MTMTRATLAYPWLT